MTAPIFPYLSDDAARACGMGKHHSCCAYLVLGRDGFWCGREDRELKPAIEHRVLMKSMTARRLPRQPFPACQSEEAPPEIAP